MSSQRYRPFEVPQNSTLELEQFGPNDQQSTLSAEPLAPSSITEQETSAESNHQDHLNTTSLDHGQHPDIHIEIDAASLTSEHEVTAEQDVEQAPQQDFQFSPYGRPLRRFYFRTIVGSLGPIIVVCYLIIIWRIYLASGYPDSPTAFGPPGAKWVFYSWFVAGIIGLNLSLYGLAGAEAGMLMEPTWKVSDAMRLMLHADGTWSGPSGWMKAMKWIVQMRRARSKRNLPGRLWLVLALPSVVVFSAWPLSGLCLEITSGFLHGTRGNGAFVTGFVYSDFNANPGGRRPARESSIDARVLGFGAVYTLTGFDRSQSEFLGSVPAALPNSEGVQEIFLTAQSETPIEGKAWGLLIHYNCSIVDKRSDLRLLKDRRTAAQLWGSSSAIPEFGPADPSPSGTNGTAPLQFGEEFSIKYMSYRLSDNATLVEARKEPRGQWDRILNVEGEQRPLNVDAVIETAYESWPIPNSAEPENVCNMTSNTTDNPATAYCYYNINENSTSPYPGTDQRRVFEVLLWQGIQAQAGWGNSTFNTSLYNLTIDHNITELYGDYTGLFTGFDEGLDDEFEPVGEGLTAIGVSCTSSSSVGTADIDGVHSTYSNFERTDSPIPARKGDCARRFGAETLACTLDLSRDGWFPWLFDSIGAPPPLDKSNPENLLGYGDYRENSQLAYLQASQLRQSLLQAFSNYATFLMYNNGRDFVGADGSRLRTLNPNVTAFTAGTVITSGVMPASIPVALFGLWALISSALCLIYGFRRRWSAILDGHTVFRLGVELSEVYKTELQQHSTVAEIEECSALHAIPGLIGDIDYRSAVGRIGLVDGKVNEVIARKDKLYR
ncbi:hypothetical protein IQ07DRAFT_647277 [Pyrenochaeta sp. DS3sAY3a]|nr:hypothetical protein IQ07DRAFT_647277 [Pyrenochaeta sp. DS3sAY3a]